VDIVPVRQRDLEALAALVRDLLEPGLDGGSASDAGRAFALERDELGAERVSLLDQGIGCRRAAVAMVTPDIRRVAEGPRSPRQMWSKESHTQ
jgi:hypothetical protein